MKATGMALDSVKKGSVRFNATGKNEDGSHAAVDSVYINKDALTEAGHDPDKIKSVSVTIEVDA